MFLFKWFVLTILISLATGSIVGAIILGFLLTILDSLFEENRYG